MPQKDACVSKAAKAYLCHLKHPNHNISMNISQAMMAFNGVYSLKDARNAALQRRIH